MGSCIGKIQEAHASLFELYGCARSLVDAVRYDEKSLTTPNLATHFTARKLILPSREMLTFSGAKHHINIADTPALRQRIDQGIYGIYCTLFRRHRLPMPPKHEARRSGRCCDGAKHRRISAESTDLARPAHTRSHRPVRHSIVAPIRLVSVKNMYPPSSIAIMGP